MSQLFFRKTVLAVTHCHITRVRVQNKIKFFVRSIRRGEIPTDTGLTSTAPGAGMTRRSGVLTSVGLTPLATS